MMNIAILRSVACGPLAAVLMMASPGLGHAFDEVVWTWDRQENASTTFSASAFADLADPARRAFIMVEALQMAEGSHRALADPVGATATSSVAGILNAAVSASATAVVNNLALSVALADDGRAVILADLVQYSRVSPRAHSAVNSVWVQASPAATPASKPAVMSLASGVGNNLNLTGTSLVIH